MSITSTSASASRGRRLDGGSSDLLDGGDGNVLLVHGLRMVGGGDGDLLDGDVLDLFFSIGSDGVEIQSTEGENHRDGSLEVGLLVSRIEAADCGSKP